MPKISGNNEKIKAERQEAEKVALILFDRIDISVAKSLLQEIVLAPLPEYRLEQLRIGDDFWPDKDLNAIAFIQDYLDSFSF